MLQTWDTGFVIGGWSYIPGQDVTQDPLVIKTDGQGNFEWSLDLGGPYMDDKAKLCLTPDSCIMILTAYADSMWTPHFGYTRIEISKVDIEGNIIWNKKYGASRPENFVSKIILLDNGDYLACGYTLYSAYLDPAGWLLRINSEGDSLWYREYYYYPEGPDYGSNYLYDVSQAEDGGFIAVGQSFTFYPPNNTQKMWALKVDSVGCEISGCWVGIDEASQNPGPDILATGELSIWPNPAQDWVSLRFLENIPDEKAELRIYNLIGKQILNKSIFIQNSSASLNISGLIPGIYIVFCKDEKGMERKGKMVVH